MTATFWIGDLCYVMHDVWDEVCSMCAYDNSRWEYQLEDGRTFFLFSTAWGDGVYEDQQGGSYPVDSGTIGAILLSDIRDDTYSNLYEMGCIHDFESALTKGDCQYNHGEIVFGSVRIDTGGGYGDEEEEDEEEYNVYNDED